MFPVNPNANVPEIKKRYDQWVAEHPNATEGEKTSVWIQLRFGNPPSRASEYREISRDEELATVWAEPLAYIALSERIDAAIHWEIN